jgi:LPXTG-motif cell wall-anchored protein
MTFDVDGGLDEIARVTVAGADVTAQDFAYAYPALSGVLLGRDGQPQAGATITFVDSAGTVFTTVTDGSGRYVIEAGPGREFARGDGSVTAVLANGARAVGNVTIVLGQTTVLDLVVTRLPATGSDAPHLLRIGVLLLVLGVLMAVASRRRRRRPLAGPG